MRMRPIFSLTLGLFFLVWGFSAIDQFREWRREGSSVSAEKKDRDFANLEERFSRFMAAVENPAKQTQVDEIDRQIQELESMKQGFEARALRHDDQAQRLQFEDRAVLETRRHNELAEENRLKAQRVQQEIDRLKEEKQKLLRST